MAEVTAHITGTIFKIEAQVGSKVAAGDEVVILESMKMEIPLESPIDGVVKEILVEEGQAVEEGDVVAVIE
ncbi:MAG: biotin/lipoyl-binding protein [bacterium]|nr:biotin/lipoyl-binding protein [bacterium]